jgi:ferredoxin, 2Fe-2S
MIMLRVVIENMSKLEMDSNVESRKVIEIIHDNYIDWMHACGKKGRCTTCKMIVKEGMNNLQPLTERELHFRNLGRLASNERLSCQAILEKGILRIEVAEENKFPHITYS